MQPDPRFLMAYCERLGVPAFWAEPLNALTNAAFLIAAIAVLILWKRLRPRDWPVLALIGLMTLIGIGSFLFHTIPNGRTVLMDVLPIQGFILGYLGLALRRFLGLPLWAALAGPVVFFLASAGLVEVAGSRALAGGIGYLPALLALFGFALALGLKPDEAARGLARGFLIAGCLFTLSLTLRTLDKPLCGDWPAGLHFLWHLLNASVLFVLARMALSTGTIAGARR
jgi:hypothetical protein